MCACNLQPLASKHQTPQKVFKTPPLKKKAINKHHTRGMTGRLYQLLTSWWLNQPIWKICSSNFIISPTWFFAQPLGLTHRHLAIKPSLPGGRFRWHRHAACLHLHGARKATTPLEAHLGQWKTTGWNTTGMSKNRSLMWCFKKSKYNFNYMSFMCFKNLNIITWLCNIYLELTWGPALFWGLDPSKIEVIGALGPRYVLHILNFTYK